MKSSSLPLSLYTSVDSLYLYLLSFDSNLRVLKSSRRKLIRKEMITRSKEVNIYMNLHVVACMLFQLGGSNLCTDDRVGGKKAGLI